MYGIMAIFGRDFNTSPYINDFIFPRIKFKSLVPDALMAKEFNKANDISKCSYVEGDLQVWPAK